MDLSHISGLIPNKKKIFLGEKIANGDSKHILNFI